MKWVYRILVAIIIILSVLAATLYFVPSLFARLFEPVSPMVENPTALEVVPLSGMLVTVYDGIVVSDSTTALDISGRGITGSLKAEIRQLTKLKTLNLSNNQFTGLPAEVGQLRELEVLNLSGNPLTGLPYELGNLSNLKVLDIRGTTYSKTDLEIIRQKLPPTTQILKD